MPTTDIAAGRRRRVVGPGGDATPAEEVIQTSFRLPRSRWTKLQQLSIEERITVQSIIVAALEKEFESRGKKF